jgi:hypothetical protein
MNANNWLKHPSVTIKDGSLFIEKSDGILELRDHDCACPPGTVGGLRLNSSATWARANDGQWVKASTRTVMTVLKWAIAADDIKMFFELLNEL